MAHRKQILKRFFNTIALGILCLATNGAAYAATCTSAASAIWNVNNTWSCGHVPTTADNVIITTGHTITMSADAFAISVTVNAGGKLTQSKKLTTSGALSVAGTLTSSDVLTVGGTTSITGLLNIDSNHNRIFTGAVTIAGGVWNNTGNAQIFFRNGFTFNSGTFNAGTNTHNFEINNQAIGGSSQISIAKINVNTVTLTNNGTLKATDDLSGNGGLTNAAGSTLDIVNTSSVGTLTASALNNTVVYSGATNQNVLLPAGVPATYYHLILNGSLTKTFPNTAMTIGGNLTLSGTVIVNTSAGLTVNGNLALGTGTTFLAGNFNYNLKGNLSGTGTLTPNTSTFTFNGTSTAPQAIAGPYSFFNLALANASGVTPSGEITILGNFTNTNTATNPAGFTAGTGSVTFAGSSAQSLTTVPGALTWTTAFQNLTMNNSQGLTLNCLVSGVVTICPVSGVVTVSGLLTLTSGNIVTDANTLAITSTGSVTRNPMTGGYIIGNLSRYFAAGDGGVGVTRDFAIGTSSGYAPVSMTFYSVTTAGSMTAKTTLLDHPQIDTSVIDIDLDVNLYWTLSKDTNLTFDVADVTFNFTLNDLDNNAVPQNFVVQSYTPDVWANTMLLELGGTFATIGNVKAFGDFAVGQSTLTNFPHEKEFVFTRELY